MTVLKLPAPTFWAAIFVSSNSSHRAWGTYASLPQASTDTRMSCPRKKPGCLRTDWNHFVACATAREACDPQTFPPLAKRELQVALVLSRALQHSSQSYLTWPGNHLIMLSHCRPVGSKLEYSGTTKGVWQLHDIESNSQGRWSPLYACVL